jgi:hypothetical protein
VRKQVLSRPTQASASAASGWLDLEQAATVELTSEDAAHPIESALRSDGGAGWRAAEAGEQEIRLRFDEPQRLRRIRLVFHERETARTQEFVLRWSADAGRSYREIVRQQFNFSPPGTESEIEEYTVELDGVSALELRIVPDVNGRECRASLAEWRVA